jgi:tRNA pseudouridine13 synthase
MLPTLAYLYGKPKATGLIRSIMADFKVFEQLPFEPCSEGEHLLIHVRKIGQNTLDISRALAKYFNVKDKFVSYAGLKDRFAITEQWFGVHLPGKSVYDLSDMNIEGIEVLSYARHNKKLRIGALTGNKFELTLREVSDIDALQQAWLKIIANGVPNYFGEQRFGIDGGNINKAIKVFAGKMKVKDKKKRGFYLSAARSYLFNDIVSKRIEHDYFNTVSVGDVCMLAGTQSVFLVKDVDQVIVDRLIDKDIDITAPMWGAGELTTQGQTLHFEQQIAANHRETSEGLPKFGLKQERRRIRLNLSSPSLTINESEDKESTVTLKFSLPAGCYATTILRELIDYKDLNLRS